MVILLHPFIHLLVFKLEKIHVKRDYSEKQTEAYISLHFIHEQAT